MKKQRKSESAPIVTILTNRGLMRCTVAEFDPSKYKGLKQNLGKPRKQPEGKVNAASK